MSPEYKIGKENPPTEESCLEFIRGLMSRDLRKKENRGLHELIEKYGPAEIMGQAADLMLEATQVMTDRNKVVKVDKYLKEYSSVYSSIHEWMERRIERQKREDNLIVKSAIRVTNQIVNSPTGRSAGDLIQVIHSLDDISNRNSSN